MKKALIIAIGLLLGALVFFLFKVKDFYSFIYKPRIPVPNAPTSPPEKTVYNILLLGYGGEGHDGPYLTDSIMVLHLDTKNNKALLVSVPRDLWVKLPTKSGADFHTKINSVFQVGFIPNLYSDIDKKYTQEAVLMKSVLSEVTGLNIDNYVGIDFQGFISAIDIMDGIDINVTKTFDDVEYPIDGKENDLCGKEEDFKKIEKFLDSEEDDVERAEKENLFKEKPELETFFKDITENPPEAFPCRYEKLHFDAGPTHMDGATALKYVRSRHSLQDGTDFGRAARQQHFLEAVKDKVFSIGFIPKIIPLLEEEKKHVKTDLSTDDIQKLLTEAKDVSQYRLNTFVPSGENYLEGTFTSTGQSALLPKAGEDNWTELRRGIQNILKGITPTPTKRPITPSPKILPTAP